MFFYTARSIVNLAKELLALCRERLASYKVPKRFGFTAALPRSAFGKVLKREFARAGVPHGFRVAALRSSESTCWRFAPHQPGEQPHANGPRSNAETGLHRLRQVLPDRREDPRWPGGQGDDPGPSVVQGRYLHEGRVRAQVVCAPGSVDASPAAHGFARGGRLGARLMGQRDGRDCRAPGLRHRRRCRRAISGRTISPATGWSSNPSNWPCTAAIHSEYSEDL